MQLLMEAKQQGLTQDIGISNFNIAQTQLAIDTVGAEHIATNQIELSPYLQNTKLVDMLKQHEIDVTSYMTLAYGKVLQDPVLKAIAADIRPVPLKLHWHGRYNAVLPSFHRRPGVNI